MNKLVNSLIANYDYVCKDNNMLYEFITTNKLNMIASMLGNFKILSTDEENLNEKLLRDRINIRNDVIDKVYEMIRLNEKSKSLIIPIKGFVPYILTENEYLMKFSNDLDILGNDYVFLEDLLLINNYVVLDESCDNHEYSKLENDHNIYIEIHKYFPVLSINYNNNYLSTSKITYDDILSNSINVSYNGSQICVPGYEMTTLISCAHAFKSFAWEPYKVPCFRFLDIIEAYILSKHSDFNIIKFKNLIHQFNAHDAVAFCSSIINEFFDDNPFAELNLKFLSQFKITNDRFGPWIKSSDPNFFAHLPTRTFKDVLTDLNANVVINNKRYDTGDLSVIYPCFSSEPPQPFNFHFAIDNDYITITISLLSALKNGDNFFLHTGSVFGHLWIDDENRFFSSGDISYDIQCNQDRSTIIYRLRGLPATERIGMILSVGTQTPTNETQYIVPLWIQNDPLNSKM